jgi:hypothetical protein
MIPFLALWAAHAAPFGLVPVQGELTNAAGTALDGPAQVDFALYADAAATTPSWEESRTLDVEAGAFTAYLGEVVDLDLAWFADNPTAVLVMTVDGDQLDPVPIAYTPLAAYAERAGTADHALDADSLQGLGPDAFLPSDWQPSFGEGLVDDGTGTFVVDRTTVEGWAQEVCFDTEDELTALLDDDYLPADWQPPLGTGFEQLPEGTWVVDEDQIAAWAPGTTYQAGVALDLNGTTFDVDRALVETWARDVAFDTESEVLAVLPADLADGDADTRYSAGAGLVLSGTTMSADRPTIESWAAGVCFDQESELTTLLDNNYLDINWRPDWTDLRDVPADIADGDADTTYTAGNGLQLSGTRFDLDETRVGELARDAAYDTEAELRAALDDDYLPSDHVVAWADIDDRPAGLDDGDDDTTYSAGTGLTQNGTTFAADAQWVRDQAVAAVAAEDAYLQQSGSTRAFPSSVPVEDARLHGQQQPPELPEPLRRAEHPRPLNAAHVGHGDRGRHRRRREWADRREALLPHQRRAVARLYAAALRGRRRAPGLVLRHRLRQRHGQHLG